MALIQRRRGGNVLIAAGVGILLVAIGVLWVVSLNTLDPDEVKAEFTQKVMALNQVSDIFEKDRLAEELLEVPEYKKYARGVWNQLSKAHAVMHETAKLEQLARADVEPFLARLPTQPEISFEGASRLRDEVMALRVRYGATRYGPKLEAIEERLRARLKERPGCWSPDEWAALQAAVAGAALKGDYVQALALIDEFGKRYNAGDNPVLDSKLQEQRGEAIRRSEAWVDSTLRKAWDLERAGNKPEARQLIDNALPRLKGLSGAARLEAYRRELR